MPATFVPWPLSSWAGVPGLTQLTPVTASSSWLARSMPVSSTATAVVAGACASAASRRRCGGSPGGAVSPAASACMPMALTSASGSTQATPGVRASLAAWPGSRSTAKPFSALGVRCELAASPSWRWRPSTAASDVADGILERDHVGRGGGRRGGGEAAREHGDGDGEALHVATFDPIGETGVSTNDASRTAWAQRSAGSGRQSS